MSNLTWKTLKNKHNIIFDLNCLITKDLYLSQNAEKLLFALNNSGYKIYLLANEQIEKIADKLSLTGLDYFFKSDNIFFSKNLNIDLNLEELSKKYNININNIYYINNLQEALPNDDCLKQMLFNLDIDTKVEAEYA